MFDRNPLRELAFGGRGRPPVFVVALIVSLAIGLFADAFVELRPLVAWLRLDPAVWERGQLWRVVTFGVVGVGGVGLWTAGQLLMVYWLAMELCTTIGERRTRVLLAGGIVLAGVTAATVGFLRAATGQPDAFAFAMVQGQHIVLAVLLPAFAVRHPHSVLHGTQFLLGMPLPTKWIIPIHLIGTLAVFAALRDVPGLAGVLAATAWGMRTRR